MTLATRLVTGTATERVAALRELQARATVPSDAERAALLDCLGDGRKAVQRAAAEAAAQLHGSAPELVEVLHDALSATDPRLRWGAVFALSLIGPLPVSATPVLLESLATDDGDVRWAAADKLKQLVATEPSIVDQLIRLVSEGTFEQRKMGLYCLRDLAVMRAADSVAEALQCTDVGVRLAALAALARLAVAAIAAERITALLKDPDQGVRRAAAATLGSLGVASPAVVSGLKDAARSSDLSLRRAATRSLQRLELGLGTED